MDDGQAEVLFHCVEVTVVVQQRMAAGDAECADDQVGCLADGDAERP